MTDGITVQWSGPSTARRIRFEPLERPAADGDWYKRVQEMWTGERWREVGSIAVEDVEVELSGEQPVVVDD